MTYPVYYSITFHSVSPSATLSLKIYQHCFFFVLKVQSNLWKSIALCRVRTVRENKKDGNKKGEKSGGFVVR